MNSIAFANHRRPAGRGTFTRRSIMAATLFALVIGSAAAHESGAPAGQDAEPVSSPSTPVFWERYRRQREHDRH